jgi:hypothetical protein
MFTHVPTYGVFQAGQTYKPTHFSETKVRLSNSDVARRAPAPWQILWAPLKRFDQYKHVCFILIYFLIVMENLSYIILYLSY